jgi:hypothetical protein
VEEEQVVVEEEKVVRSQKELMKKKKKEEGEWEEDSKSQELALGWSDEIWRLGSCRWMEEGWGRFQGEEDVLEEVVGGGVVVVEPEENSDEVEFEIAERMRGEDEEAEGHSPSLQRRGKENQQVERRKQRDRKRE